MEMSNDIGAAYSAACAQAARVIEGIRPDQLDVATPCSAWDTRALLNHFVGSSVMMATCGSGGAVGDASSGTEAVDAMGDLVGDDPSGAYASATAEAQEVFSDADALERVWTLSFGEIPGAVALNIHLMETVGHTWDLAKATGQLDKLDPDLAATAEMVARGLIQPEFRNEGGDPFGAELEAPAESSAYDRFAAFLGRTP